MLIFFLAEVFTIIYLCAGSLEVRNAHCLFTYLPVASFTNMD